jgi:hypothetical protein
MIASLLLGGQQQTEGATRAQPSVLQDNGQLAPMTQWGRGLRPNKVRKTWASGHNHRLKPLEEWTVEIDVAKIYDLHKPGTYTIIVSRETDEMVGRPDVAWFRAVSAPMRIIISQ